MSKASKEAVKKIGGVLFSLAQKGFAGKPIEVAERRGERLGLLLFKHSRKHRERCLSNLALAFPEWSEERRLEVAYGVFRHFGRVAADFLRAESLPERELLDSISVEGQDVFDEAAKTGAILVTGHFGNWERMARYMTLQGYALTVVVRDADDAGLNSQMRRIRESAGLGVVSRGNAARELIRILRNKGFVAMLPDQNADEAFIEFFGQPAGTVLGPAVIAQRTGKPIVPAYCVRVGPGKYRTVVKPPLEAPEGDDSPEAMMQAYYRFLEEAIREYPEQWLWFHDRWKSARRRNRK